MSITPLILTLNEAPNIGRVLQRLAWAERVVVVDSGSTDETLEICKRHPNVEVVYRKFDNHTVQWNFGLDQVRSDWCLSLDADYVVPEAAALEMLQATKNSAVDGYYASLRYCIHGKPLRSSILPPRLVLFRVSKARYRQDGHTQLLHLDGTRGNLTEEILHDDRKPLGRWLWAQDRYAALEADKILKSSFAELGWADRVRRARVIAPWLVPAYYLVARGGVRDGWAGADYAAQRAIAELVLALKLLERRAETK